MKSPYSRFDEQQLTLRDELAVDRTVLANERTMLGYIRTSLGFLVLGLTFLHFLEEFYYHLAGYAFMAVAVLVLSIGITRFLQMRRGLNRVRRIATGVNDGKTPGVTTTEKVDGN
jgi:putative membrane protein